MALVLPQSLQLSIYNKTALEAQQNAVRALYQYARGVRIRTAGGFLHRPEEREAAHLIHGSSEGRFRITYCPGHLSRNEMESVNFGFAGLSQMLEKYDPAKLKDGYNTVDGEEIFFVPNPALGLCAHQSRF